MTAMEEVNKTSLKDNSLFGLKDFLSESLNDETIGQETIGCVFNNRRSIQDRGKNNLYYIADLNVDCGTSAVKDILRVTRDNRD